MVDPKYVRGCGNNTLQKSIDGIFRILYEDMHAYELY